MIAPAASVCPAIAETTACAAIVMLAAFFVVLLSAVVDIFYAFLDPRIRLS